MLLEPWGSRGVQGTEGIQAQVVVPGREFKWKTTEADSSGSSVLPTQPATLLPHLGSPVPAPSPGEKQDLSPIATSLCPSTLLWSNLAQLTH